MIYLREGWTAELHVLMRRGDDELQGRGGRERRDEGKGEATVRDEGKGEGTRGDEGKGEATVRRRG